jgi:hypothetical protein
MQQQGLLLNCGSPSPLPLPQHGALRRFQVASLSAVSAQQLREQAARPVLEHDSGGGRAAPPTLVAILPPSDWLLQGVSALRAISRRMFIIVR